MSMSRIKAFYNIRILFFLIFILFVQNYIYCQDINTGSDFVSKVKDSLNASYGLNPLLINGRPYQLYSRGELAGDQFFIDETFLKGELSIKGNSFKNVLLNYDINSQDVLVKYDMLKGSYNIIKISKEWLQSFKIDRASFINCQKNDFPKRIYQVIGNDSIQIYYYSYKSLDVINDVRGSHYEFILHKNMFVSKEGTLYEYTNNRSFVKIFEKTARPILKKYLRTNKIKVNNASDQVMELVINKCNNL